MIDPEQLTDENDRLRKLSPLTILGYMKTQIEIIMQMKMDEENSPREGGKRGRNGLNDGGERSEFTSTF